MIQEKGMWYDIKVKSRVSESGITERCMTFDMLQDGNATHCGSQQVFRCIRQYLQMHCAAICGCIGRPSADALSSGLRMC